MLNPVYLDNYITGHWGEDQLRDDETPLRISRTFGQLPTRDEFQSLWEARGRVTELLRSALKRKQRKTA